MKSKFLQKVNNFFNSGNKAPESQSNRNQAISEPRVISFGNEKKSTIEDEEDQPVQEIDTRYSKIEEYPSLKDLGLKKNQIEIGQVAVFFEPKLIFLRSSEEKYDDVIVLVTNYKLCLQHTNNHFQFIVLGNIEKLHRSTENDTVYKIVIELKDGRDFKFRVSSEVCWRRVYERLEMFSFIRAKNHFFAYKHFEEGQSESEGKYNGWKIYQPLKQFKRMGISIMENAEEKNAVIVQDFKILDNRQGKVCSTYPPFLIVPSRISNDSLIRCAKFRSRERMPALTYAYEYEKEKFSCIFRSSQSKVGVKGSRSIDDELMLKYIGNQKLNSKEEKEQKNCKIYDARNYYAALGNRIAGKGYQSQDFYPNCKLEFLNIPNIHAVRQSYNKIIEACQSDDTKFMTLVAESKWYEYIFLILAGALDLANSLIKGMNSLVHCSDGWDRTSQLCALAGLLLDPYYRTIEGFMVLIEKDWIHFGHQFKKRLAQGINDPGSEEKSQIFLQFLDCVSQIVYQFPHEFEFQYKLILEIANQTYSHLYGNFLCNNYNQMLKFGIFTRTKSLWSKILEQKQKYVNQFYQHKENTLERFDCHQRNYRFWKQYFLQYSFENHDVYEVYSFRYTYENIEMMYKNFIAEQTLLEEKAIENQQQIKKLDKEIACLRGEYESSNAIVEEKKDQGFTQQIIHENSSEKQRQLTFNTEANFVKNPDHNQEGNFHNIQEPQEYQHQEQNQIQIKGPEIAENQEIRENNECKGDDENLDKKESQGNDKSSDDREDSGDSQELQITQKEQQQELNQKEELSESKEQQGLNNSENQQLSPFQQTGEQQQQKRMIQDEKSIKMNISEQGTGKDDSTGQKQVVNNTQQQV